MRLSEPKITLQTLGELAVGALHDLNQGSSIALGFLELADGALKDGKLALFVLEVEEEWNQGGESWYCRELLRADVAEKPASSGERPALMRKLSMGSAMRGLRVCAP